MWGKRFDDGEAFTIRAERSGPVTLGGQYVADLVVGYREVTLPYGIGWILRGKSGGDGEALAIGDERSGLIALSEQYIPDLVLAY